MTIEIREVDPRSALATGMIAGSSAEQIERYGRDGGRTAADLVAAGATFVVALIDGEGVGCGAVVPLERDSAELSRIFVTSSARRRGVASAILRWLEQHSLTRWRRLVLETGTAQGESVALYEAHGFTRIPCWGKSADNPRSLCYEKRIASSNPAG